MYNRLKNKVKQMVQKNNEYRLILKGENKMTGGDDKN